MSTIKLIYSHGIIPGKYEIVGSRIYHSINDVFFKIPDNVTIYFSNPGRGNLAISNTSTEHQLKDDLEDQGIAALYTDPEHHKSGMRAYLNNMGIYTLYFPDLKIGFEKNKIHWNIWSREGTKDYNPLIPYGRWDRDAYKDYSLKEIINRFSKQKHHYLVLQLCNPIIPIWEGAELIKLQKTWSKIMDRAHIDMKNERQLFLRNRPRTRNQMIKQGRLPIKPEYQITENESKGHLWSKDSAVNKWDMLRRRNKIYGITAAMRKKKITRPKYSDEKCYCKSPCQYKTICDSLKSYCYKDVKKKCRVDPYYCYGKSWSPCSD